MENKMANTIEQVEHILENSKKHANPMLGQILADQKILSKVMVGYGKQIDEFETKLGQFDSKIEHIDKEQRDIQIRLGVIEKIMVTKDELTSGLSNLKIDLIKWMIGLTLGNTALILTILKTFSKF